MMINNDILTKIETDKSYSFEQQYGFIFFIIKLTTLVPETLRKQFTFSNKQK